ncbi:MAG: class I SAM-dependent methyltransferase [Anaerolineales bacterium]|nr:class I SAM-dependent methyltransferase [Anaerolineales bacterium]
MNDLSNAGERGLPPSAATSLADRLVYLKHQTMYAWTHRWTRGRQVLDLGCGEGYGSHNLAEVASSVVAADYSPAAARHVLATYGSPRLRGVCCDGERLLFAAESFDVVVSFEVIEHVPDVACYLRDVQRVLRSGGAFLVSSPNRLTRPQLLQRPWNPHHLREYTAEQYDQALRRVFPQVEVYGVTAIPEIGEIERKRVRRAALRSWSTRLARGVLPVAVYSTLKMRLKAWRRPVLAGNQTVDASSRLADVGRFTAADFSITNKNLDGSMNLVAVCIR